MSVHLQALTDLMRHNMLQADRLHLKLLHAAQEIEKDCWGPSMQATLDQEVHELSVQLAEKLATAAGLAKQLEAQIRLQREKP